MPTYCTCFLDQLVEILADIDIFPRCDNILQPNKTKLISPNILLCYRAFFIGQPNRYTMFTVFTTHFTLILLILGNILQPAENITSPTIPQVTPRPQVVSVASPVETEVVTSPAQSSQSLGGQLYAYSSTPDQTNGNPFITASGKQVVDGIVANNCLPFGTVITIPDLFGDKQFRVQDRMAARYGCESFDIWYPNREAALQFGKRRATVYVQQ